MEPGVVEYEHQQQNEYFTREMNRGQRLGPDLAKYTEQKQNAKEQMEDLMGKVLAKMIPVIIQLLEAGQGLMTIVETISE